MNELTDYQAKEKGIQLDKAFTSKPLRYVTNGQCDAHEITIDNNTLMCRCANCDVAIIISNLNGACNNHNVTKEREE